jgi:hypothetical protein
MLDKIIRGQRNFTCHEKSGKRSNFGALGPTTPQVGPSSSAKNIMAATLNTNHRDAMLAKFDQLESCGPSAVTEE